MTVLSDPIPQNDLREFIKAVEAKGELARVKDAHWDRELGAVAEVLYRQKVEKSPMLLFDEIPEYPKNYQCLYGMFGSPYRLALVLGMEPTLVERPQGDARPLPQADQEELQAYRTEDGR